MGRDVYHVPFLRYGLLHVTRCFENMQRDRLYFLVNEPMIILNCVLIIASCPFFVKLFLTLLSFTESPLRQTQNRNTTQKHTPREQHKRHAIPKFDTRTHLNTKR